MADAVEKFGLALEPFLEAGRESFYWVRREAADFPGRGKGPNWNNPEYRLFITHEMLSRLWLAWMEMQGSRPMQPDDLGLDWGDRLRSGEQDDE